MKRTPLKRGTKKLKRSLIKKKKDGRDWSNMTLNTHRDAGGICEWCKNHLPLGTLPAHIIERAKNDPSLDESWNLALLGYVEVTFHNGGVMGCLCHNRLDRQRGKAYQDMLAEDEPCELLKRILANPRLKKHFDRRLAIWEVKQEQAERNRDE